MWLNNSDSCYLGEALISQQEVERDRTNLCLYVCEQKKKKEKAKRPTEKSPGFPVRTLKRPTRMTERNRINQENMKTEQKPRRK